MSVAPSSTSSVTLWAVSLRGPDDIIACPSFDVAEAVAAFVNSHTGLWSMISAAVIEWPYSAEAHSADVARNTYEEWGQALALPDQPETARHQQKGDTQ